MDLQIGSKKIKIFLVLFMTTYCGIAQSQQVESEKDIRFVRTLETDDFFSAINLNGIVFPPNANTVLTIPKGTSPYRLEIVPQGEKAGTDRNQRVNFSSGFDITYSAPTDEIFLFQNDSGKIQRLGKSNSANNSANRSVKAIGPRLQGVGKTRGSAIDPETGRLYFLHQNGKDITVYSADSSRERRIRIESAFANSRNLLGLAFDPSSKKLTTIDPSTRTLYSIDDQGKIDLVATFPESEWEEPIAMVYAPSLDTTDDPLTWHLYTAHNIGVSGDVFEWAIGDSIQ